MRLLAAKRKGGEGEARSPTLPQAWHTEEVFHDRDLYFRRLRDEIARARRSVELETYIFDRDPVGNALLSSLEAAAERGVRVRLLLDGVGCAQWGLSDLVRLRHLGVKARIFHPLPWQNPSYRFLRYLAPRRILLGLSKLNRRNHRKACVIDGQLAFVGGMNVTARPVRDTSALVTGPGVTRLSRAFDHAWNRHRALRIASSSRWLRGAQLGSLRLNESRVERRLAYADLLSRVLSARHRVWIANPYFVPDVALLRALRFAAWNGVDIRLVLPRESDVPGFRLAAIAYFLPLLAAGARIFEYPLPRMLHAKVVLVDGWALMGSSNLNHRSLLHDLEVDLVLSQPASLASLEHSLVDDLAASREVTIASLAGRPLLQRMLQPLMLLFRRFL